MRIVSWNVRRAKSESGVWPLLSQFDPDIALLQEVGSFPPDIGSNFKNELRPATTKNGTAQKFGTAILTKGRFLDDLKLSSKYGWVNAERDYFNGNIVGSVVAVPGHGTYNVVSVYSPAWPVNEDRINGIDVSAVKLSQNPQVWVTEILWSLLQHTMPNSAEDWIVGGDFNSSETFDYLWKGGPRGNKEIIDRMAGLNLRECLRGFKGELIPTFRNPRNGKVIHQLDHVYVSLPLYERIENSAVGDESAVFSNSLSDHLPIVTDFRNQ